jgi:hypothetical protein
MDMDEHGWGKRRDANFANLTIYVNSRVPDPESRRLKAELQTGPETRRLKAMIASSGTPNQYFHCLGRVKK